MKYIMYIGGTWGDYINFQDNKKDRIYGFRPWNRRCSDGSVLFDLAGNRNNDTIPLYYVKNIRWQDDPNDMFFADIELIGNVDNPKNGYGDCWYAQGVEKLQEQLKEELCSMGIFNLKRKSKLREYIRTLQGMY